MFELKPLSPAAIPSALAKAERYRLLNDPEQAASICEDVLRAQPDCAPARVMLVLALTDAFKQDDAPLVAKAHEIAASLPTEYERAYYTGVVAERRARAVLARGRCSSALMAGDALRQAMEAYERAEAVRPPGNDDALLRWNACVRLLEKHPEMEATDPEPPAPAWLE